MVEQVRVMLGESRGLAVVVSARLGIRFGDGGEGEVESNVAESGAGVWVEGFAPLARVKGKVCEKQSVS